MDVPLSQYFCASYNSVKDFNTVAWLKTVDNEILARIGESSKVFFNHMGNEAEMPFEGEDYLVLCYMIIEHEKQDTAITEEEKITGLKSLNVLAEQECLRRKGMVEIFGSGKLLDPNNQFCPTRWGKMVISSYKTLGEMAKAIDE